MSSMGLDKVSDEARGGLVERVSSCRNDGGMRKSVLADVLEPCVPMKCATLEWSVIVLNVSASTNGV